MSNTLIRWETGRWTLASLWSWLRRPVAAEPAHPSGRIEPVRWVEIPGYGRMVVGVVVNAIGDGCPKPQILTLKAINQVAPGVVVELISDNPTAVETIPAMMEAALGLHLMTQKVGGSWHVFVCKQLESP